MENLDDTFLERLKEKKGNKVAAVFTHGMIVGILEDVLSDGFVINTGKESILCYLKNLCYIQYDD